MQELRRFRFFHCISFLLFVCLASVVVLQILLKFSILIVIQQFAIQVASNSWFLRSQGNLLTILRMPVATKVTINFCYLSYSLCSSCPYYSSPKLQVVRLHISLFYYIAILLSAHTRTFFAPTVPIDPVCCHSSNWQLQLFNFDTFINSFTTLPTNIQRPINALDKIYQWQQHLISSIWLT